MIAHRDLWPDAPQHPPRPHGEVHVWRAHLEQSGPVVESFAALLTADERERAGRYYFSKDREHFIVARGALRTILSRYVGVPPARLRFSYNRWGKPALAPGDGDGDGGGALRFNVAHAHSVALYAVTWEREIGIDIEFVREDFAGLEIAERFFSPDEAAALMKLAPEARTVAFFDCWTRKEAYIKALGEGLSRPLDLFTVSLVPGAPAALLRTHDDPREASRWSLIELSPEQNYRAALAVEGEAPVLRCWQFVPARGDAV